jgi:NAD(P)-dependent dehydrogenase (short-subunit alcohol dehydrogenase family)
VRLAGKNALITGGNSGIGLATLRRFVAEGARVAVTGRDRARLGEVSREFGSDVLVLEAETTDPVSIAAAFSNAQEWMGPLDIVFANAGIAGGTPTDLTSLEEFERLLRTNVTGSFLTVAAALPHLNDGASVILTGSVMAGLGFPGTAGYAASKGAVVSMAKAIAAELSPRNIRVNVIAPGPVQTPIMTPERAQALSTSIPLGRTAAAEEVANLVVFLASDESPYIQAQEILIDGGALGAPAGSPAYR